MRTLMAVTLASFVSSPALAQSPTVVVRDGRLLGSGPPQQIGFGTDVALSGATAVVGVPRLGFQPGGEAMVFVRGASGWSLEATLAPSDPADFAFGISVAIDGDRIAIGARSPQSVPTVSGGAVYVFERSGGQWTETARLIGTGAVLSEALGFSVALQGDTIACGAPRDPHNGAGAAYVFVRGLLGWTQQARFEPSDGEGFDYFGFALALDGDRVAVGSRSDNHPWGANGGSVYVFERAAGAWSQVAKLIPSDNAGGDEFGSCLDLEGDALVVGAPLDDAPGRPDIGSLYVFARSAGGWAQTQKVDSIGGQAYDGFGGAVDLDGERLLVGEHYGANFASNDAGAAYLLERAGAPFGLSFNLACTAAEQWAGFGSAVALAGELALVAAYLDDSLATGEDTGAVYLYRVEPMVSTYCTAKVNSLGCLPAIGSVGLPLLSAPAPFVIVATNVLNQQGGVLFWGLRAASVPFQGGTRCVAMPVTRLAPVDSGGSVGGVDCSGAYAVDFSAYLLSGVAPELLPGSEVFAQFWTRDPLSPSTTGSTDGLHFHVRP